MKTSGFRNIFLAGLLAGSAASAVFSQGEFFTDWNYYKKITLNTSSSGADLAGNVNDFPVLIRLTSASFDFGQARDDGGDVRFSMSSGAELQYEIERWDKAGKAAEIWVRVTQIVGNDNEQYIVMYWGNAQASGTGTPSGVFQTSNNFQGVWHLGENGNTAAGGYADATDNQYHGTGIGMTESSGMAGAIGMAQDFFPGSHVIIPGSAASSLNFPEDGAYTISAWVNLDAFNGDYQSIVSKGDLQYIMQATNSSLWQFTEFQANTGFDNTSSPAVTGTWVFLTGVRNGPGNQILYVNGAEADNSVETTASPNGRNLTFNVAIGFNTQSNQPFDGRIDEVRLSSTVRSADWIKLCYENQKPDQTLVEPGSIVKRVSPPAQENYTAGWRFYQDLTLNTSGTGADVAGTVTGFPILVRLNASNFDFGLTKRDGSDIRFSTTDNTQLFYEIERWNSDLEKAEIWVGAESIAGGSSTQAIRMQWGNPDARDNSASELVFGADKGFAGVWHLNQDTAAGDPSIPDAASSSHNGTNKGTTGVAGNISGAASFNDSDYIDLPGVALSGLGNVITLSAWQFGDAELQPRMDIFFQAYNASSQRVISIHLPWNDSQIMWDAGNSGNNFDRISKEAATAEFEGAWNYWTFTKNVTAQTMEIFLNGKLFQSGTGKTFGFDAISQMKLGSQADGTRYHYAGYIDEFRLSLAVRNGDWIKLCYENQKPVQTLVEFGAVVDRTLPDTTPAVYENYADDWSYFTEITLNTTASGADVAGTVFNFPLLIRLDSARFDFSQANADGSDIRFAGAGGSHLAYEVESWSRSAARAAIWVLADQILGNNNTQTITMYWGNPNAADSSDGTRVFRSSDSFTGVWHLGEDGNTAADGYKNAVSFTNAGTGIGMTADSDTEGIIGTGQSFDGVDDCISIGNPGNVNNLRVLTASAWMHPLSAGSEGLGRIFGKYYWGLIVNDINRTRALTFYHNADGIELKVQAQDDSWTANAWHHVAVVTDGSLAADEVKLYVDGVEAGYQMRQDGSGAFRDDSPDNLYIGSHDGARYLFKGILDELRISNVPRSADWIKLSYESQKQNPTLLEFEGDPAEPSDTVPNVKEDYARDWRYSAEITLNTTASGANILENQVNFPVLIRLDGNIFRFDQAAEHGNDIRFAKTNGLPLAYDIERWDNSAERADIWVRADTVFGSRRQTILMYWGNPGAADSSSGIRVFRDSDSYAAVYHMNEDPSGGAGAVKDRTSHGVNATAYGSMASEDLVEGPAGQAIAFDGNNDYLDLGAITADFSGGMTVCAWVRYREFNYWSRMMDCSRSGTEGNVILANVAETDALFWANRSGGTVQIGSALVPDAWTHVCGTLEVDAADTIMHLYRDGVRIGSDLNAVALTDSGFTSCFIGKSHFPGDKMLGGVMDEVRLSTVPRSPDWIRLSYENQKFNQALVEMTAPGPVGGDSVVYIGAHARLIVPSGIPVPPIRFQSLGPGGIPAGFAVVGPALVFDPVVFGQPVTVSLELDTALVGAADRGKARIYERTGAAGEIWTLIEPRVSGSWYSFTTSNLGIYVLALDTLPPVMTLLPGTAVSQGGSLAFTYDAADNTWNPAVTLVVRQGGSGEARIPLPNIPGTIQTDTIPAAFISQKGLSYRLEVTDGVNTRIGPVADVTVGVTETMVMDYSLTAGAYQMFSIPLKSSLTVSRLFYPAWGGFNQEAWRLYRYDGAFVEYQEGDNSLPAPGQVFWLKTVGFTPSVVLPPGAMTTNPVSRPYAVSLNPGWNFISNPFAFDVRMDSLRAVNGGEPQFIYTYDPAAKIWMPGDALSSLETWRGYLVWNSLTGPAVRDSLRIPAVEHIAAVPKFSAGDNGSFLTAAPGHFLPPGAAGKISISVSSGTEQDGLAVAGFNMEAPDAGAQYPKPEFWPRGLEIYFSGNRAREMAKYLTDYRGPLGKGQTWTFTVENRTGNSAARLEFTGLEQLPDSLEAVLLDPGRERVIPLIKPAADYLQGKSHTEKFQLLVGTPDYVREQTHIFKARFGGLLEQNAPNPFSSSTRIIYRVPFDRNGPTQNLRVALEVFDLSGKHIKTLVSGRQASGLMEVMWDRKNSSGRAVPAGTYIYRLRVGEGAGAQRKMLVVD